MPKSGHQRWQVVRKLLGQEVQRQNTPYAYVVVKVQ